MMKKPVQHLWPFFLIFCALFPATQEEPLDIAFRVMNNTQKLPDLNRNDIRFTINGIPRQVMRLMKRERSLSRVPDLGRHFILSFHEIKVTKSIENAISYIFTEILNPKDSLILLSPEKAYRIPITRDKEKMIMDVTGFLDKDCTRHQKDRVWAEKNLETLLHRLNAITGEQPDDFFDPDIETSEQALAQATNLAVNYKAINQVLLNFPQNFTRFKNRYLLPDIIKHKEINDLLEKKQGEKWWIHFQHRENLQIIHKARSAGRRLNRYISTHETGTLAQTMQKSLADLEKNLIISDSIKSIEILNTLLGKNICYNVVNWGSIKTSESDASIKEASDLEAVLHQIAEYSGGKSVVATDPEQGIRQIRNHTDRFYQLIYEFDGNIEHKKIHISAADSNLELSYRQNYSEEEMRDWLRTLAEKRITIRDFLQRKNSIQFGIDTFERNREEEFGILKVRISLFDGNNTPVYKSENTLRASRDKVKISIPLPTEYRGEYRLCIEVFDLLANTSASSEHLIELN